MLERNDSVWVAGNNRREATNWRAMCPRCRHASALTNNAPAAFAHKRVLFVGDSISEQLYAAFSCLAQNMAPSLARPAHVEQTTAYTFGSMTESALGLGLPGTPGFLLHKFRVFDVIVLEIGSHYHAWENVGGNCSFERDLARLLRPGGWLFDTCLRPGTACALVAPPANHARGGLATEGSIATVLGDCHARRFADACGPRADAFFDGSPADLQDMLVRTVAQDPVASRAFGVLRMFDRTVSRPELHPGRRANHNAKTCDCLHLCHDEAFWEATFAALAETLRLPAPALR